MAQYCALNKHKRMNRKIRLKFTLLKQLPLLLMLAACSSAPPADGGKTLRFQETGQVKITDAFWAPRFRQWTTVTAVDVWDKFEGRVPGGPKPDTFENFDRVARGERDSGWHAGLPWFDGLVYETLRGAGDLLTLCPDSALEQRMDGYIDRIAAAQASEESGYLNTYAQLIENGHRWGENGGLLRWMHDVYNAGMLVEAGVHYYKATGKTKLLAVATRMANLMCDYMGPAPKHNLVPAHSGPEEAMVKLYRLYRDEPDLSDRTGVPADAQAYLNLAEFWIENRGHHCGLPLWGTWGNGAAEQWIRENRYADPQYGSHSRPSFGPYAQDSIPVFDQQTIEGHAVRATLLMTGVAAAAIENGDTRYADAATRLWDNMVGKRYFVTGGVGAVHFDEKFGPDYYLPADAYLETCAAVGVAFYSQKMNELTGDARYMDEVERALYNNVLTGISLDGTRYTYQNPLNASRHARWQWHDCPCCPPMFLKLMSAMPGFVYATRGDRAYVNLYIGSETVLKTGATVVHLSQETDYPWSGDVAFRVEPDKDGADFTLCLRIPGWARSQENPYGLYRSTAHGAVKLNVNGTPVSVDLEDGYATLHRHWKKGDRVELSLPVSPRFITAHPAVEQLKGQVALAAGPLVYCLEGCSNPLLEQMQIDTLAVVSPVSAGGLGMLQGKALARDGQETSFCAVPYFAVGNSGEESAYKVWLPMTEK